MLLLLLYTARGAVSENKFPKGPIEKAHEFSITSTERIERRERGGKSSYPKTYNNTCLILFPLGSKIGGRVSSIFFLLSNSRVSVGNIQLCRIGIDELVPPLKKK